MSSIKVQKGSTTVTGLGGTTFTKDLKVGSTITANGESHVVSSIESDTSLTTDAWDETESDTNYTFKK
jgi:hypothetical protein